MVPVPSHLSLTLLYLPRTRYFEDENENMKGEVPGGLFTGQYTLEFPEGK